MMPAWASVILGAAAVAGAILYLWRTVAKPAAHLVTTMDKLLPVAKELAAQFHDVPEALVTLRAIALHFRPNSGTSLIDIVKWLKQSAQENREAAETIRVNLEAAQQLAADDRIQLANLIARLDLAAEGRVKIADDLEQTHRRAEAAPPEADPGVAADAAARREDTDDE